MVVISVATKGWTKFRSSEDLQSYSSPQSSEVTRNVGGQSQGMMEQWGTTDDRVAAVNWAAASSNAMLLVVF